MISILPLFFSNLALSLIHFTSSLEVSLNRVNKDLGVESHRFRKSCSLRLLGEWMVIEWGLFTLFMSD